MNFLHSPLVINAKIKLTYLQYYTVVSMLSLSLKTFNQLLPLFSSCNLGYRTMASYIKLCLGCNKFTTWKNTARDPGCIQYLTLFIKPQFING